jgi:hypothetical protein
VALVYPRDASSSNNNIEHRIHAANRKLPDYARVEKWYRLAKPMSNAWQFTTNLLAARDFGRVTATANLGLIYEWGQGRDTEFESALHVQARYRFREALEPALELHRGQDTIAIGPALTGLVRGSKGRKLRWELGLFTGADSKRPDRIIKANIEIEFRRSRPNDPALRC